MTSQQAAPDKKAAQMVVASPLWRSTSQRARTDPAHSGSSNTAMISLHHFSMVKS
jgi:hypothetical protein